MQFGAIFARFLPLDLQPTEDMIERQSTLSRIAHIPTAHSTNSTETLRDGLLKPGLDPGTKEKVPPPLGCGGLAAQTIGSTRRRRRSRV